MLHNTFQLHVSRERDTVIFVLTCSTWHLWYCVNVQSHFIISISDGCISI